MFSVCTHSRLTNWSFSLPAAHYPMQRLAEARTDTQGDVMFDNQTRQEMKANLIISTLGIAWRAARRAAVAVATAIAPHPTRRGLCIGRGLLVAAVTAVLTTSTAVGITVLLVYGASAIACGRHRLRPDDSLPRVEASVYTPTPAPVRMTPPEHAESRLEAPGVDDPPEVSRSYLPTINRN
jgi:hypothetical protein